jgi:cysteine-rich repeat protein
MTRCATTILSLLLLHVAACGFSGPKEEIPGDCANGIADGDETAVDCGGSCAQKCSNESQCKVEGDCASGLCIDTVCKEPRCGDGVLTPSAGEGCDDGDLDNGDGCNDKCVGEMCGNGNLDAGEECDLGVADNSDTGACTTVCLNAFCGDGNVQTGVESCDGGVGSNGSGTCASEATACTSAAECPRLQLDINAPQVSVSGAFKTNALTATVPVAGDINAPRVLIVGLGIEADANQGRVEGDVTFGGKIMTRAIFVQSNTGSTGGNRLAYIYYLAGDMVPPPGGSAELKLNLGGVIRGAVYHVTVLNNASGAIVGTATGIPTGVAPVSTKITTTADRAWIVDVIVANDPELFSPQSGQLERADLTSEDAMSSAHSTELQAVATVDVPVTWTAGPSSNRFAHAIAAFAPATAPVACNGCSTACAPIQ